MWSCSKVIQDLYFKHDGKRIVAINVNYYSVNITQEIKASMKYYIPFYSILFSIVSLGISIIIGFLISVGYLCNKSRRMFSINFEGENDNSWTTSKKTLYGILFILRIPIYISVTLIYTYMLPNLVKDKIQSNIKFNENVRVFTLLTAYLIDNFLFPYEILK
jgi:hypothetical protein